MKILLVDAHPVVREGFSGLLQSAIPEVVILQAATGEQALERTSLDIPALVVTDISLPGISGLETCRRLLQRLPQLPVLFFSAHTELALVRQAMAQGARGYVGKASEPQVLLQAVQRLLAGHPYIEQSLATELACQGSGSAEDLRLKGLSARELEVFVMLARGVPGTHIAEKLCISSKTVANYCTQVKHKLQAANQAELVHLAMELGILHTANRVS
ncbi:MAG: response regulator transcription factor [Gammaproteobacteria bacterium]|nr:response regulator transcription factor [Gammaproteobacteria bacterium]